MVSQGTGVKQKKEISNKWTNRYFSNDCISTYIKDNGNEWNKKIGKRAYIVWKKPPGNFALWTNRFTLLPSKGMTATAPALKIKKRILLWVRKSFLEMCLLQWEQWISSPFIPISTASHSPIKISNRIQPAAAEVFWWWQ